MTREKFIGLVAFLWSVFQLVIVKLTINDTLVRSIHLGFALILIYLTTYTFKNKKNLAWIDYLLSLCAGLGGMYLFLNYKEIVQRSGMPTSLDLFMGVMTIALLLEAARRTLGFAIVLISVSFLAYCYFGPHLPDLIAHRGASVSKIVSHMYLETEGIFGVPIAVSASFVFLFVLFGAVLDRAGAGHFFMQLTYTLLGRFRGGPAKAAVVASGLTGMISGSSIANTVTTGAFTIPLMKKIGFSPEKAAAIEASSGINGQLMPPVMGAAAFIMAEFLGVPYIDIVKAAFIPGIISYVGLFALVHFESVKLGIEPIEKSKIPDFWPTVRSGFHFLIPVIILVYALVIKETSATLAAFYGTLSSAIILIGHHMVQTKKQNSQLLLGFINGMKELFSSMIEAGKNMCTIALATALAGIIVGSISLTGLGQSLLEIIQTISGGNFYVVLILTALSSIILGMGVPTTANYIIMASLLAPVLIELGQNAGMLIPAIAVHMYVFYFGILADVTPPVALAAYAASGIALSNPFKTGWIAFTYSIRTAILPFIFLFNTRMLMLIGVQEGGSPLNPADWIWDNNTLSILYTFLISNIGMIAFVSFIVGWFNAKSSIVERLLFLLVCASLLRPMLTTRLLGLSNHYLGTLPFVVLFFALIFIQSLRSQKIKTTG